MDIIPKKSVHHCWKPEKNAVGNRGFSVYRQTLPLCSFGLKVKSTLSLETKKMSLTIEAIGIFHNFTKYFNIFHQMHPSSPLKKILPFGLKKGFKQLLLVAPIPFSQGSCKEVVNTSNSSESPESSSFCCGRGVNICRVISKCLAQVVDLWLQLMRTQNLPHK